MLTWQEKEFLNLALLYVANFEYKYNSKFYKLPYQILANLRREFDKKRAFLNICPFNTNKEYIGLIKNNEWGFIHKLRWQEEGNR